MKVLLVLSPICLLFLSGCAGLRFGKGEGTGDGIVFYDPVPYLLVTYDKDCVPTATPVVLPGKARNVHFEEGYGSASLNVSFSNGMIASAGQVTDVQVPATLSAFTGLAGVVASRHEGRAELPQEACTHPARLYAIREGVIDLTPIPLRD